MVLDIRKMSKHGVTRSHGLNLINRAQGEMLVMLPYSFVEMSWVYQIVKNVYRGLR